MQWCIAIISQNRLYEPLAKAGQDENQLIEWLINSKSSPLVDTQVMIHSKKRLSVQRRKLSNGSLASLPGIPEMQASLDEYSLDSEGYSYQDMKQVLEIEVERKAYLETFGEQLDFDIFHFSKVVCEDKPGILGSMMLYFF